jgi:hypothetical protein
MTIKEKRELFNNWYNLAKQSRQELDEIRNLRTKLATANDHIFKEKIQPTAGFFVAKPTPFIEPNTSDWGITLPCKLTIYRNALEDNIFEDGIVNKGTPDDVKEFNCPLYTSESKCTKNACPFNGYNHQHFDLPSAISDAESKHNETCKKRKEAWAAFIGFIGRNK